MIRSSHPDARGGARRGATHIAGLAVLAVIASCLGSCGAQPADDPRLVVLYATCTVNKDYLGPYNPEVSYTPGLDRFAREAAVFGSHRTESGISGTSFASIFAGVQADRHGVFKHPRELGEDLHLVFEAFAEAGYETFYWAAHDMAAPSLAYAQGVDDANVRRVVLSGRDVGFLEILDRLEKEPGYRALVVTSFSVTHTPWDQRHVPMFRERFPDEAEGVTPTELLRYLRIFQRNTFELQADFAAATSRLGLDDESTARLAAVVDLLYKSKIHLLDRLFESVLDAVDDHGLAGTSLIVFTADHGQQLRNEDRLFQWTHGPDLAPEVIDVPLLVRGHGGRVPPRRIDDVTRSIDVYPSLAGLAGVPLPEDAGVEGADLSRGMRGEEPFPELSAYSHGTLRRYKYFDPDVIDGIWASVRIGADVYLWRRLDGAWDFAVERGPDGARTSVDPKDPALAPIAEDLWAYRERMIAAYREQNLKEARSKAQELELLDEDEKAKLRALGYIE